MRGLRASARITLGEPIGSFGAILRRMSSIDEILAMIRRLPLPDRLRLIERARQEADEDTPRPAAVKYAPDSISPEELLASRVKQPPGVGPVSLEDMERAIIEGALGRGSV